MSKKHITNNSRVHVLDQNEEYSSDAAIVTLAVNLQHDQGMLFRGTARRHPDDRPDADVAVLLATARAYRSFAHAIEKRAQGLVKHKDDIANLHKDTKKATKSKKAS